MTDSDALKSHSSKRALLFVRRQLFICIFLGLAILAIYSQMHDYGFVIFDDLEYVAENHGIRYGSVLERISWATTAVHSANWHPLTWLSHALDVQLFGLSAGKHHLVNMMFHMANSLFLFLVLKKMTGHGWRSGLAAALFALHPINVETVAWISQRKSLLSTFFMIIALWFYSCYANNKSRSYYGLVFLSFILGLSSKPMIVTFPFILLLMDYWPLERLCDKKTRQAHRFPIPTRLPYLLLEKAPFFILAAIISLITIAAQKSAGAVAPLTFVTIKDRLANAILSYADYLVQMIWPLGLAAFYPFPDNFPLWKVLGALTLLFILSSISILRARRSPWLIVGWLWYLGTLIPVIGLVQVGSQAMANRYAYVPMIGVFIMIAWAVPDEIFRKRIGSMCIGVAAAVLLSALMVVSWQQTSYWQDSISLFKRVIAVTPNSAMGHYNLAVAMENKGNTSDAIFHYRQAVRLNPRHVKARMNLGLILYEQGNWESAIHQYHMALKTAPADHEVMNNLGLAYAEIGETTKAIKFFRDALRISPSDPKVHNNLGIVLFRANKVDEAIFHLKTALSIFPGYKEASDNLRKVARFSAHEGMDKKE